MADYTFLNLSPAEFEDLCRDLMQKKFSVSIESFTTGRDGGIDLRYTTGPGSMAIIQCKRYSSLRSLISNLKKEAKKLPKLSPQRYILCTSVGLTPKNKNEISNLLSPYVTDASDIIGRDDLNGLLRDHGDIEKNHFKLWFGSTQILDALLSNRILSRSTMTEDEIRSNTNVYVPTPSFTRATEILEAQKYVVISGIPGIGKTTLARMLALQFLSQDYSFIDVSFDIDEAQERFGKEERQVFYYDDFLGKNFLEEGLRKNEDRRLVNFIKGIRKSRSKVLLMTTREYILTQAKQRYELFKDGDLDIAKCIVDIESYNKLAKARILYNHLYFSGLSQEYMEALTLKRAYRTIIAHANYNPRLIQLMTKREIADSVSAEKFVSRFVENLDHPNRIWEDAFNSQIREYSQLALFLITLSLRTISEKDLFAALSSLLAQRGEVLTQRSFKEILRELEGTFISISRDGKGTHWISFQNPSVFDFMAEELRREKPIQDLCIKSARFFNHLLDIFAMSWEKYPLSNQIVLEVDMATVVEDRISEDFGILEELEEKGRQWKATRLERCVQLVRRFPPKDHPKIKNLAINLFGEICINSSLTTSDKEALSDLLCYIGDYIETDHVEIISSFFEVIEDSHDAASFSKLRDFDYSVFSDFCYDHKDDIHEKLRDCVESDVYARWTTTDEISAVVDDIDAIESEFTDLDFSDERKHLEEEKEEIEAEELAKVDYEYEHWKGDTEHTQKSVSSEEDQIDNLFDSLNSTADED